MLLFSSIVIAVGLILSVSGSPYEGYRNKSRPARPFMLWMGGVLIGAGLLMFFVFLSP